MLTLCLPQAGVAHRWSLFGRWCSSRIRRVPLSWRRLCHICARVLGCLSSSEGVESCPWISSSHYTSQVFFREPWSICEAFWKFIALRKTFSRFALQVPDHKVKDVHVALVSVLNSFTQRCTIPSRFDLDMFHLSPTGSLKPDSNFFIGCTVSDHVSNILEILIKSLILELKKSKFFFLIFKSCSASPSYFCIVPTYKDAFFCLYSVCSLSVLIRFQLLFFI